MRAKPGLQARSAGLLEHRVEAALLLIGVFSLSCQAEPGLDHKGAGTLEMSTSTWMMAPYSLITAPLKTLAGMTPPSLVLK